MENKKDENKKSPWKVYATLGVIVLFLFGIVAMVFSPKESVEVVLSDEEMQCISENTILVVSEGCGYCKTQKEILEDYLESFKIIDGVEAMSLNYTIQGVPSWIVGEDVYAGVKSPVELKILTGC